MQNLPPCVCHVFQIRLFLLAYHAMLYDVKKALLLFVYYIIFLLLLSLFVACMQVMAFNGEAFASSMPFVFFSFGRLIDNLLLVLPITALVALVMIITTAIRKNLRNWQGFLVFAIITLGIMFGAVPVLLQLASNFATSSNLSAQEQSNNDLTTANLKTEKFRQTENGLQYVTRIDGKFTASAVQAPRKAKNSDDKIFEPMLVQGKDMQTNLYAKDLSLSQISTPPRLLSIIASSLLQIIKSVQNAFLTDGYLAYLGFGSFALVVLALWLFSYITSWPLFSALSVMHGLALSLGVYYLVSETTLVDSYLFYVERFFSSLAPYAFFKPLFCNVVLAIIFAGIGLSAMIIRKCRYGGSKI